MKYNIDTLRKNINNYFSGTISNKELGKWAEEAYYDLLKGSYVETRKIILYPFLKTISKFHIESNDIEDKYPCSKDEVKYIKDILDGKNDFDFTVEMSIPFQVYNMFGNKAYFNIKRREVFVEIRDAILFYVQSGNEINNDIFKHINFLFDSEKQNKTIQDMLEEYIFKQSKALFDISSSKVGRKEEVKLYAQKTNKDFALIKLLDYLDCYIGERNFCVTVSFRKGISEMLLLV